MNNKIQQAVDKLNKNYGVGSVISFNKESVIKVDRIPSGSLGVDLALGGGWARGRIIEVSGPESSGKTTLALHAIAEVHKQGGVAAFIDAEHAFDPVYAEDIGVEVQNADKFLFSQPMSGEEALEIARELILTYEVDIIIIDSVAALIPKAELQGDVGDSKMGLQARMMSQAMRMLTGALSKGKTTIIFTNQIRQKLGVIFGPNEVTTGGNALKFYASIRCDIRRIGLEKNGEEVIASKTRLKVVKNKTAPPFRKAEFDIVYGQGIDIYSEIVMMAVELKVINKAGSWYSYNKTKLGQGAQSVNSLLADNPELYEEIRKEVIKQINQ